MEGEAEGWLGTPCLCFSWGVVWCPPSAVAAEGWQGGAANSNSCSTLHHPDGYFSHPPHITLRSPTHTSPPSVTGTHDGSSPRRAVHPALTPPRTSPPTFCVLPLCLLSEMLLGWPRPAGGTSTRGRRGGAEGEKGVKGEEGWCSGGEGGEG